MDAFFASVEMLDDPRLRGRPVLVGHDSPRGVVSAASYEARAFGCRSAQPMAVAKRMCPQAVVVPVRFDRYRQVSAVIFDVFESFTPAVEPLSIDEAFLDLTGTERLHGDAVGVARRIKADVKRKAGITASVGVAPNKFLAKLASDLEKPDGLTVVTPETVDAILSPLPVSRLWGVGPKTVERLAALNVRTIADLRKVGRDALVARFGDDGDRFDRLAHGRGDRPVVTDREAKSIGHEQTFGTDLTDPDAVRAVLLSQAEAVSARLRRHGLRGRSVTVKIRFGNFQTITRRSTLPAPADTTDPLWHAARGLFDAWAATSFAPVRLIGLTAADLAEPAAQMDLFPDPSAARSRKLDAAIDTVNARFGKAAVRRAGGQ